MTRVFALFATDELLQNAMDELEEAGLSNDIERIINPDFRGPASPDAADSVNAGPEEEADEVTPYSSEPNWLWEFAVTDGEARRLGDAVDDGSTLVIANSEDSDVIESIFRRTGGRGVFSKQ